MCFRHTHNIFNSGHVLIDKMVLELLLCCIVFSSNSNGIYESWSHPTYSEISQLSAEHYIICEDPGATLHSRDHLHSEDFSGYP
jgi:hypothetical protein